jgi:hypothetical protein
MPNVQICEFETTITLMLKFNVVRVFCKFSLLVRFFSYRIWSYNVEVVL